MRPAGGRRFWPALAAGIAAVLVVFAAGSQASPRFLLVVRLARPHTSPASALTLARSLGFDGPTLRESPSSYVVTDHAGTRQLVLFKASGGFDYVDERLYRQAPNGSLPAPAEARSAVTRFLFSHALLPASEARVAVRRESRSVVVTVMPIQYGTQVLEGAITFWLGAGGAVERLRDEYRRPSAATVRVAARSRRSALAEVRSDLGTTSGIRLRLAYVAEPSYLEQPYLDPVYEAVRHGVVLDRVRATTFTPQATITAPNPSVPIVAGAIAKLRARASEGRHPYHYSWWANRSGFLGTGKALDVPLQAGDTELRLRVRDSSGAGTTYAQPVHVLGAASTANGPPQPDYGDAGISFRAGQDRTHPLYFRDVEESGLDRVSAVYFDQFRYSLTVRYQEADWHVTSGRCVPLTVPGDACDLPKSPQAQSAGATVPASGGGGSRVESRLTIGALPGTLTLLVEGIAEPSYCGPTGELGSVALAMLPKLVFGTIDRVGADCPAFRPSVEWTYAPPAVFRPSELAHLCLQGPGLCDVPEPLLAEWASGSFDAGPQPQVTDFRLSVYTAVVPAGPGPDRSALARDADSPVELAASDGALDPSCRPRPCISPIASERSALLAAPESSAQWDALYLKSESPDPLGISFPDCSEPVDELDGPPCLHIVERWPGQVAEEDDGQTVTGFIVRSHPTEASPKVVESLVDGEPLRQDAAHGYDLVLWHRSSASSTECYPSGGVDNTARPCRVFGTPLFFTPR